MQIRKKIDKKLHIDEERKAKLAMMKLIANGQAADKKADVLMSLNGQ